MRGESGSVVRVIGTEQDVTDRELASRDLAEANARLTEADRLKTVFLASISHELRTPLNSIIGFTTILLEGMAGPLNEEQGTQLDMVKRSATHLLSLINDVLDVSRIEANQAELDADEFVLGEVVTSVIDSVEPLARTKKLEVRARGRDPRVVMRTDKRKVRQILLNLVGNAVKFTDEGFVEVHTSTNGTGVEIVVRDTGPGIQDADRARLFRPFAQLHDAQETAGEGTGLGLYLSRRLARLLGGDLDLLPHDGGGAAFQVRLPKELPEDAS